MINAPFVLNRAVILERLGGDEEIYTVMVDMYLQDLSNYAQALQNALKQGDAPLFQREAHTIKGLLATFADEAGAEAAFTLEKKAKAGDLNGLDAAVDVLVERLNEVGRVLSVR